MQLTTEVKIFIGIIVASLFLIGAGVFMFSQPEKVYERSVLLTDDTHTKGNQEAPVYLVEFSDFECPACGSAFPVVSALLEEYGDRIVFGYRHFPLAQHAFAQMAAEAAEAAGAQGKFWEMHDVLFQNQTDLSDEKIQELATELELDMDQFNEALDMETYKEKVQKDQLFGTQIGVNSTPTFFLNGKKLVLSSFSELEQHIQKVLTQ